VPPATPRTDAPEDPARQVGGHLAFERTLAAAPTDARDPRSFRDMLTAGGAGWAAADGTGSVALGDGRTLWLFGDTLVRTPAGGLDFVRNSAVLQDGRRATTLLSGTAADPDSLFAPTARDEWYWPAAGIADGDDLLVFAERMHETTTGAPGWNFTSRGTDIVRLDPDDLSVRGRVSLPTSGDTDWGTALVAAGAHTYVYGFKGGDGFDRHAVVARGRTGHLDDEPLEYWDGRHWSANEADAAPIADGVSNAFSVLRLPDGRYAMVSQELFFGTRLQASTAPTPHGPWSAWHTIDQGPAKREGTISYNALVHPEATADGTLLVSWNRNRADASIPGADQLDDYRPVFRAVDLDRISG
jgi:hypothetical protein